MGPVCVYHRVYWAWDSTRITSLQPSSWAEVYAPGWEYVGLSSHTWYYYNDCVSAYSFRQGHFRLGAGGWIIQNDYPWISVHVHRGGNYSVSGG